MYQTGIYCRVSIEEKDKKGEYSNSIRSQIQMAEDYIAEQKDVMKVKVYVDDGASGGDFNRTEFRRLLADMELGIINMVIFKDISRLGREHIDTNYYLGKYFPERQIRIVSLLDHYDSRVSTYDELLEIKTLMNDMYLRDTSKKIRSAIQAKRSTGEYTPKEPPFGYVKSETVRNHLEIDPYAAEVVRRIFEMYLRGFGCTIITRTLNEDQIPSPARYKKEILKTGYAWKVGKGIWTTSAVSEILKNPVYTGAIVLRKTEKLSYKLDTKRILPLEEKELVKGAHDAIISEKDFEQAQMMRKKNCVPYFDKKGEVHKYTGLLFCGKCKTVMRKRYSASHNDYDGYMCGFHQKMGRKYCELNHITFEKLDALVAFAVNQQFIQRKGELDVLERQLLKIKSETDFRVSHLKMKIAGNRESQRKAYEQFMDEVISKEKYLELKNICGKENEKYQTNLRNLEEEEQKRQERIVETRKWLAQIRQGGITTEQLTRDVLVELIDKIYVYPEQQIEICFRFAGFMSEGRRESA